MDNLRSILSGVIDVVAGVLERKGRVLAGRRVTPPHGWEFPGGKVEQGESPEAALARELREELAIHAQVGAELPGPVDGCWPISARLRLRVFWVASDDEPALGHAHDRLEWLTPDQLRWQAWLPADAPVAAEVARQL